MAKGATPPGALVLAHLSPELCHTPLSAPLMDLSSHHPVQSLASRLKDNMEKLTEERDQRAAAENREKEQNKRLQRQLRDTKEEMGELARKEAEASRKKHELVMPPTHEAAGRQPSERLLNTHLPTLGLWRWAAKKPWFRELEG